MGVTGAKAEGTVSLRDVWMLTLLGAAMVLVVWAMGDGWFMLPALIYSLPIVALLLAGLIIRGLADSRVRRFMPRGGRSKSSLRRVADFAGEHPKIIRSRFDGTLNLLADSVWACAPAWRLVQVAGRGDWPRTGVLATVVIASGWIIWRQGASLLRASATLRPDGEIQ